MPISDTFTRLPLSSIWVDREARQRSEVASQKLLSSIRQRGVLNPIIVEASAPEGFEATLVAGEGRLAASRELGLEDIPVRWVSDLDPLELQIIELEENIKRTELPWQDLVRTSQKIHALHLARDPSWTAEQTAEAVGLSPGQLSQQLRVAEAIVEEPHFVEAGTMREVYNALNRRQARREGEAIEELLGLRPTPAPASGEAPPPEEPPIRQLSFLDWAPQYSGSRFNLLHIDFPYGTSAMVGPQARGGEEQIYSDSPETFFALLDCFAQHWRRFTSSSAHILFWCSARICDPNSQYSKETWGRLSSLPIVWWHQPLIWNKTDNAGVIADPRHGPRHTYEVCLFGSLGTRQVVRSVADIYSGPTDRSLHPSTKPEPMLNHFFSMLVDSSTRLLDPTCGAGSALRSADRLGAEQVLGLEINSEYVEAGNRAFRNARMLRRASEIAKGAPAEEGGE